MPFQGEKRPYMQKDVLTYPGFKSGVYGIFKDDTLIYIGTTGDIKARVLRHLARDIPEIAMREPNFWTAEQVSGGQAALDGRLKELLEEYTPLVAQGLFIIR